MLKQLIDLPERQAMHRRYFALLVRVLVAVLGSFVVLGLALSSLGGRQEARAAPLARPLANGAGVVSVTHTANTTHEMRVFERGRITDQFLTDNGQNQIGTSNISATTIAVAFDQHASTGNEVDVGSQLEFSTISSITLDPASDIPGYSEDSYTVYASRVLPYQIAQRTLATSTHNCVIMELVISNIGSTALTGGKLLYMVDIQVGKVPPYDRGSFDPTRRLVYQTDHDLISHGYAMGISLLEGDLRGYGILTDTHPSFPGLSLDADIKAELMTPLVAPTHIITVEDEINANNLVSWLVANIPDLNPGQAETLAFGLCARAIAGGSEAEAEAEGAMFDSFKQQTNLSAVKTAMPPAGSSILAGESITYSIIIASNGYHYVDNIVITDTVPTFTNLVTYTVTQGDITEANGLITATVGRLYPTSDTVTITMIVTLSYPLTKGTIISNKAFVKGEPIIAETNVVTHQIVSRPILDIQKTGPVTAKLSDTVAYSFTISHANTSDLSPVRNITVTDNLAGPTKLVSGDANGNQELDAGETWTYTVSYTIPFTTPDPLVNTGTVAGEDQDGDEVISIDIHSLDIEYIPILTVSKSANRSEIEIGNEVFYRYEVSHAEGSDCSPVNTVIVTDDVAGPPIIITGDFGEIGLLECDETWVYLISYEVRLANDDPLINTATVTGKDKDGDNIIVAIDTYSLDIEYNPVLTISKAGPVTANFGDQVIYAYEISHDNTSDFSPLSNITVTDNIAGPTALIAGDDNGNEKLDGDETWVYTASHIIGLTDSDPLINTAMVTGTDRDDDPIIETATHSLDIRYNPVLTITKTGPVTASIGEWAVYTFAVSHGEASDGSPFSHITITDNIAGPTTLIAGDDNSNEKLDRDETWHYTASYIIANSDDDPLTNIATVTGKNRDGDILAASNDHTVDIIHRPILSIIKIGPVSANVGEPIVYNFIISHSNASDDSPVSNITVTDNIAGAANYTFGDTNNNALLEAGETWSYDVLYTIQSEDPPTLVNTGTITGADKDGGFITSSDIHTTTTIREFPVFTLTKRVNGSLIIGTPLTYTISITNLSPLVIGTNVVVTDTLPDGANYITGGVLGPDNTVSWIISRIPVNSSRQVTFVVSSCQISLVNGFYRVVTSTERANSTHGFKVSTDLIEPNLQASFEQSSLNIPVGETIIFTDTSTTNGGPITDWVWDFGDGKVSYGPIVTHTYNDPGTYSVELQITDNCGYTDTKKVDIHSAPPVGYLLYLPVIFKDYRPNTVLRVIKEGPETAYISNTVNFTFTISHDADRSNGLPVSDLTVSDDIAGEATFVGGDVIILNDKLDYGEVWNYTSRYTIPLTAPKLLVNKVTVKGMSQRGIEVTAIDTHTISVPCIIETFDNPSTGNYYLSVNDPAQLHRANFTSGPYTDTLVVQVDINWAEVSYIGKEYGIFLDIPSASYYYRFNINFEEQKYILGKLPSGATKWTTVISDTSLDIHQGTIINTLKIEINQSKIDFYLNGVYQDSHSDTILSEPKYADANIVIGSNPHKRADAFLDNWMICSNTLTEDVLFKGKSTSGPISPP